MSRKEIVGTTCTIAFGVDHQTGAFMQLWTNPAYDQDCAFLVIDSQGIREFDAGHPNITPAIMSYIQQLDARFKAFGVQNLHGRANLAEMDVVNLTTAAGGFPDITQQVYEIFGNDL